MYNNITIDKSTFFTATGATRSTEEVTAAAYGKQITTISPERKTGDNTRDTLSYNKDNSLSKKAIKALNSLVKNAIIPNKKAIDQITSAADQVIQQEIEDSLYKKHGSAVRTGRHINDLRHISKEVNSAIDKHPDNDSAANKKYIEQIKQLATILDDLYQQSITPLDFSFVKSLTELTDNLESIINQGNMTESQELS